MATDHNQGRRGHFHRGRRGPDRRGPERRQGSPPQEQVARGERGDRVDVEQIMRDIRSRIAQRTGVELSNQQIQELAARRLEAILDPRGLKPELLEQLRRSAGERTIAVDAAAPPASQSFPFDEATLYDSPNGFLRFIRKLLRPLLRMFFNPTPIAHALAQQSRMNTDLAARELERDRRQAEWNALHYEILQRLAVEVSRASVEAQNLSLRVESLAAKVDFNERRVRTMEGTQVQTRSPRPPETGQTTQTAAGTAPPEVAPHQPAAAEGQSGDAPRRRRRRRRGRRGPLMGAPADAGMAGPSTPTNDVAPDIDESDADTDEGFDDEVKADSVEHQGEVAASPSSSPAPEPGPEPVRAEDTSTHVPEE
jgi:hypothetical protein